MSFASFYFNRFSSLPNKLIKDTPADDLIIIITIPCYNEQDIFNSLDSLYRCERTNGKVEVIINVNYPVDNIEQTAWHNKLYHEINQWASVHNNEWLLFYAVLQPLPTKEAGVGLARKIIMDEALRRFDFLNKPNGIIVGFDADCRCEKNYLCAIEKHFTDYQNTTGCSICFEHPLSGNEFEKKIYEAIAQYELHLRYYIEGLRFAKYPYAFHTLGSCFAVTAHAYAKQGGMNKRKAAEDFYFLNKIMTLGNYNEINNTCVYPSPRMSKRVPFGTGASVAKYVLNNEESLLSYNPEVFKIIKDFLSRINDIYCHAYEDKRSFLSNEDECLIKFFEKENFNEVIDECLKNSKNLDTFKKRFFYWFNGLKILQFIHFAHEEYFNKVPVNISSANLLKMYYNIDTDYHNPVDILLKYREIQRKRNSI